MLIALVLLNIDILALLMFYVFNVFYDYSNTIFEFAVVISVSSALALDSKLFTFTLVVVNYDKHTASPLLVPILRLVILLLFTLIFAKFGWLVNILANDNPEILLST